MPKRALLAALVLIVASVSVAATASADPNSPPGPTQVAPPVQPPQPPAPQPPSRGWIGVALQPVRDDLAAVLHLSPGDGALVSAVEPDGPASRAGVRVGDVIVEVRSTRVRGTAEVAREIGGAGAGAGVPIVVLRGTQRSTIVVLTAEAPPPTPAPAPPPWVGTPWPPGTLPPSSPRQLGITLRQVPGTPGLAVLTVQPGSLAASVGVAAGDVILQADGRPVQRIEDVRNAFADGAITLQVDRRGTPLTIAVATWSFRSP